MDRVEKMLGRMKAGKLYRCVDWDPEGKAKDLVDKFNSAPRSETMTRTGEYLGKLFAHMGKECYIEPPFYCDYGTNIHVGDYFYANTGLIVLDQFLRPTVSKITSRKPQFRAFPQRLSLAKIDRKSTRLNSSHRHTSRMPSSA